MLALTFCFSCLSFSALAADVKEENNDLEFQTIEEAGITREEAAEALGLTPEEAKNVDFYAVTDADHLVLNSGDTHAFNRFTFTDSNTGSNFTVRANQLKFGVIWELPASEPEAILDIGLCTYQNSRVYTLRKNSLAVSSSGDKRLTAQSDWIYDITYGIDYHFVYRLENIEWTGESITSSITMVVGVV